MNHDNRSAQSPGLGTPNDKTPRLGKESAIPYLLALLQDERPMIRTRAVAALGGVVASYPHTTPRIVMPITQVLLTDKWVTTRVAAAQALGHIAAAAPDQQERISTVLIGVLRDDEENYIVRVAACEALAQFAAEVESELAREKSALAMIDAFRRGHPAVREAAIVGLGEIGPASLPLLKQRILDVLVRALHDKKTRIKMTAAWALGNLRDHRAVPYLIELLDDPARPAISKFSDLFHVHGGQSVAGIAAQALECIGTAEATAAVERWRSSDTP
jgi:HEAT repeat protein